MNYLPVLIAGVSYFILGGIWFTSLFGKLWDKAIDFDRPPKWRPTLIYYFGPLAGCLISAFSVFLLMGLVQPETLFKALFIGLIVGLGIGATITAVNAISPNVSRPGLYAMVVGGYHLVGLTLCAMIIHYLN